jgi:hypothetical protein
MSWKIKQRALSALLLCFAILCWRQSAAAFWQSAGLSSGQLQVTVTDQNGQPLRMVIVIAQQNDKAVAQERTTPS